MQGEDIAGAVAGGASARGMRSTRLGARLAAGLAMLSLLLGAVVLTAFGGLRATAERVGHLAERQVPKVAQADLMIDRVHEIARVLAEMALDPQNGAAPVRHAEVLAARQQTAASLAWLRARQQGPQEARLLDQVERTREHYVAAQDRFLALLASGDHAAARAGYVRELRPPQGAYLAALGEVTRYQRELAAGENAGARADARRAQARLAAIAGLVLVLGALFCLQLVRSITGPLAAAVEIAERVTAGRLDLPEHLPEGTDEVAHLLRTLRTMARQLAAKRAELLDSRELLAQSQAQAHLGSWWYDPRTGRVVASDEARRLYGAAPGEELDEAWLAARVHPDDRAVVGACRLTAADGQAREAEYRIRAAGEERWVRARSELRSAAGERRVLCTLQDISLLRHREAELLESRQQLRDLAAHNEREREALRASLSRELHDEIGQYLTALRLDAAMLRARFGAREPELGEHVAGMKRSIDLAMAVLREVVAALRPAPLDTGLVPAAEWLVAGFARRTGIDCRLDAPEADLALDGELATTAFRILQEALTNVGRHAQAGRVQVRIGHADGVLRVEVADDGVGFDPLAAPVRRSFGLLGMRERALMFGGTLAVDSRAGGGTTLRVTLPITENRAT